MRKSIDYLRAELQADVGVFHHVDGCYSVISKVPEGATVSSVCLTSDGKRLILRDIARLSDEARHFRQGFLVLEEDLTVETKSKPKKKSTAKATDKVVGGMTEEPK